MNKPNMAALFKNIKMVLSNHSPEILTGLGIAGMITTTILAVSATPKLGTITNKMQIYKIVIHFRRRKAKNFITTKIFQPPRMA